MQTKLTNIGKGVRGIPYRSLTFQLSLLAVILLAAVISAHGVYVASQQIAAAETSARNHAETIARVLAQSAEADLVASDFASLERSALEVAEYPNVKIVRVLEKDGYAVANIIKRDGEVEVVFDMEKFHFPANEAMSSQIVEGVLRVFAPIRNGSILGWVEINYARDDVYAARQRVVVGTVGAVLVATVLTVGIIWMFLRGPLRALRDATDFASRIDDFSGATLPEKSRVSELEYLQNALNAAAVELRARRIALSDSREMLQLILRYAADSIVTIGPDGTIQTFNQSAERMFGYSAGEVVGKNVKILMPEPYRSAHDGYLAHYLQTGERRVLGTLREVVARKKDGSIFAMELSVSEVRTEDRHIFTAVLRDITDRKRAEELSARLGRILEHSSNEIYIFDAATLRFVQTSRGALVNLGYSHEEIETLTLDAIQPDITREKFETLSKPLRFGEQEIVSYETVFRRRNGARYAVEVRLQLSRFEDRAVFMAIVQDVTERKRSEEQLHFLANYDTLTGLPNRAQLQRRMQQAMADADRHGRLLATMFIDLDRFKLINDTMGHDAGDELLRVVSRRLVETLRTGDTVARHGGDEFVVLMSNVAEISDVDKIAEKVLQRLSTPVRVAGRELYVTPSIGISIYPTDARTPEELLKHADTAMYFSKEQGRNCYRHFTNNLNARSARRLALETSLRQALDRNEFVLHYQPQINAVSGAITGAEALIRWRHPELGMIPPNEFIPLAEDTGLIVPIGQWVLESACADAKRWSEEGFPAVRVSVNISGRQLSQDSLPQTVRAAVRAASLDPQMLDLELTESLLMQNLDETATLLGILAKIGVTVSMDDFGTGYSSLSYLKRLPIDSLKIDRAFVRDVIEDADTAAIVGAIIVMARGLKINVIAEGVETKEQFEFLRMALCGEVQGFYFSAPVPLQEFISLLKNGDGRFPVPEVSSLKVVK